MKTSLRTIALSSLLASGIAFAGAASVAGTVSAVDAKAGTVTLLMADGTTATYKAEGKAAAHLAKVTQGEKVMVAFRDEPAGTHAAITMISAEKAAPAPKK